MCGKHSKMDDANDYGQAIAKNTELTDFAFAWVTKFSSRRGYVLCTVDVGGSLSTTRYSGVLTWHARKKGTNGYTIAKNGFECVEIKFFHTQWYMHSIMAKNELCVKNSRKTKHRGILNDVKMNSEIYFTLRDGVFDLSFEDKTRMEDVD